LPVELGCWEAGSKELMASLATDRWNGQDPAYRLDILAGRVINHMVMGSGDVALKVLYTKFQSDIEHQLQAILGPAKPVRVHRQRSPRIRTTARTKVAKSRSPRPIEQARVTKVEFLS
jgi:hypothetical protein